MKFLFLSEQRSGPSRFSMEETEKDRLAAVSPKSNPIILIKRPLQPSAFCASRADPKRRGRWRRVEARRASLAALSRSEPGVPLSIAGGEAVIFIRLGEHVCFGFGVLKPLRRQTRFLRLQAPVIRMDQKWGHWALPLCGASAIGLLATDPEDRPSPTPRLWLHYFYSRQNCRSFLRYRFIVPCLRSGADDVSRYYL